MKHNPARDERWQKILVEYKTKETTSKEFCELNNIKIHQLQYWRDKLEKGVKKQKVKKSSFIKVTQVGKEVTNYNNLSIEVNRVKINVPINFDSLSLTKLIKVVRTID